MTCWRNARRSFWVVSVSTMQGETAPNSSAYRRIGIEIAVGRVHYAPWERIQRSRDQRSYSYLRTCLPIFFIPSHLRLSSSSPGMKLPPMHWRGRYTFLGYLKIKGHSRSSLRSRLKPSTWSIQSNRQPVPLCPPSNQGLCFSLSS